MPLIIKMPGFCPACGTAKRLTIHEHINHQLPAQVRERNEHGAWVIARYSTVRYRCSACRKTVTARLPDRVEGFRLQRYVAARIVAWYCLGAVPAMIEFKLADMGMAISRATIYRLVKAAGEDVKELHRVNRTRVRWSRPRMPFEGTTEFTSPEREDLLPVEAVAPDHPSSSFDVVARFTVELFSLHGDEHTRKTVTWLTGFLHRLGQGRVIPYTTWQALTRAHDNPATTELLRHRESGGTLMFTEEELQHLFEDDSRVLKRSIRLAIRTAEVDRTEWPTAAKRQRQWRSNKERLVIAELTEDALFDYE